MKDKLVTFMSENDIDFQIATGSELNGACTVISGYADHIDASQEDILAAIKEHTGEKASMETRRELARVFNFATTYNYGKWWNSTEAKRTYKF